jgi:hypothetical protein
MWLTKKEIRGSEKKCSNVAIILTTIMKRHFADTPTNEVQILSLFPQKIGFCPVIVIYNTSIVT